MRVTPRAGIDSVDGVGPDGELRIRVRALPAGGAANEAVRHTIAKACGVAPSRVFLVRGAAGRTKIVSISGLGAADVIARWPELLVKPLATGRRHAGSGSSGVR